MDVDHLRGAFLGAADVERRLTDFRVDRIAKIKSGQTQMNLSDGHFVLHICPVQTGTTIDMTGLQGLESDLLRPLCSLPLGGYSPGWNIDGFRITSGSTKEGGFLSMTQIFRNGAAELVFAKLLNTGDSHPKRAMFYGIIDEAVERLPHVVGVLTAHGLTGPFGLMISLLGVRDSGMSFGMKRIPSVARNTTHDDLLFAPLVLDDMTFAAGWQLKLRPMLDAWWNAYGLSSCSDYFDAAGKWSPPRY
jgi:hypothetical protein